MKASQRKALKDIAVLMKEHHLNITDIQDFISIGDSKKTHSSSQVSHYLSYLGGLFVFAGIIVFLHMYWNDMSSFLRITITLGSGLSCYAFFIHYALDERNLKAASILSVFSAIIIPIGLFVTLGEFYEISIDNRLPVLIVFGPMIIHQFLTFLRFKLNVNLWMGFLFFFGFFVTLFDYLVTGLTLGGLVIGTSTILISHNIPKLYSAKGFGFWMFIGGLLFLLGAFRLFEKEPFELLYLTVVGLMVYLSVVIKSKALLASTTLSFFAFIAYYTSKFTDSIGWPITLIALGVLFIALSTLMLNLSKKYFT